MNIFEKYGSYEAVRQAAENYKKSGDRVTAAGLELQCLEYRRQHNIFEVGDKVVFSNVCALNHSVWQVIKGDGSIVVAPICSFNGRVAIEANTPVQPPYSIQHATDAEIKAGKRL